MRTVLLIALMTIALSGPLRAQEPAIDTVHLKGVEIETQKIHKKELTPFPLQSLSSLQIASVAGNSVADAIRTFSGVTLRDYGGAGGLKTVMVRSLGSQHTGIFIDGAPVSDIAGGQPDLGKYATENLEEIDLNVGGGGNEPMPARARAAASIINLRSVSPDFGRYKTRGNAGIKAGSFGLFGPFLRLDRKTGQTSWLGLELNTLFSKGDYPYHINNGPAGSETRKRSNADISSLAANVSYRTKPGDSSEVRIISRFYTSERGLPGAIIFYNPYSAQRLANNDYSLNAQYSVLKNGFSLLSNAGWTYAWLQYLDPDYLGGASRIKNRYIQNELYLSQAATVSLGKSISGSLAADFILNTFSSNQYTSSNPMRSSMLVSAIMAHQGKVTGAEAGMLLSLISDGESGAAKAGLTRKWSPYLSFSVKMLNEPSLRFRMMYKHSFRMPTFNEMYYALVGNPFLSPESVRQLNAGLMAAGSPLKAVSLRLSADAFFNRVDDKIIAIPTQNLFVWSMRNIGKVRTKGIDLQAEARVTAAQHLQASVNINYTFQEAADVSDKNSNFYGNQIPYVPYETFSAMTQLSFRDFALDYNLLFNGFRYVSSENTRQNMLPSWWVSDAGFSWNPQYSRMKYSIKAGITNLFDEQYVVIKSFPMPGRGFLITGSVKF